MKIIAIASLLVLGCSNPGFGRAPVNLASKPVLQHDTHEYQEEQNTPPEFTFALPNTWLATEHVKPDVFKSKDIKLAVYATSGDRAIKFFAISMPWPAPEKPSDYGTSVVLKLSQEPGIDIETMHPVDIDGCPGTFVEFKEVNVEEKTTNHVLQLNIACHGLAASLVCGGSVDFKQRIKNECAAIFDTVQAY